MTSDQTKTILCFGDSNTHGTLPLTQLGALARHGADTRWPRVMGTKLGKGFHIIEEGLPGRTTVFDDPIEGEHRNGLRLLPAILETHRPIDLLILMLGTNDLKARFPATAGDIALAVGKLLDAIAASNAGTNGAAPDVMLLAPAPIRETGLLADMFSGGADKSEHLSGLYRGLAKARGLAFVDAGAHIAVDPLDGIHFDAASHRKFGTVMAGSLQDYFNRKQGSEA